MDTHRQTRTEYLQALWDALPAEFAGCEIEYRPFKGWYSNGTPRYFGDDGDYLGSNWRDAEEAIKRLRGDR